ncbi:MAG TPA: hypothetical protein VGD67_10440, partial [Pseudonocardiaceae bacterium]
AGPAFAAAAQLLPPLLSLLRTDITVHSRPATVGATAAAAAVLHALAGTDATYLLDDLRPVPAVFTDELAALGRHRARLAGDKAAVQARVDRAKAEVALQDARRTTVHGLLAKAADPAERARLEAELADAATLTARQQAEVTARSATLARVDHVVTAVDSELAALAAVPPGGTRSPLTVAALRAGLHDGGVTHVLLVSCDRAGTDQIATREAWRRAQRYFVLGSVSLAYALVRVDGTVVAAGNPVGVSRLSGELGEEHDMRVERVDLAG